MNEGQLLPNDIIKEKEIRYQFLVSKKDVASFLSHMQGYQCYLIDTTDISDEENEEYTNPSVWMRAGADDCSNLIDFALDWNDR